MKECNISNNFSKCNCTYQYCNKKGRCCDCIQYHKSNNELPACYFPKEIEKTYDRSINNFIKIHSY